jgi:MFS family permease
MRFFPSLFRALHQRSFALLWTGQTISRVGDFVYEIALAWWVLQKTGSAETMGLVLFVSTAPMVILLLVGGVVVDRVPRLTLMLISDAGRAVIALAVAGLAFAGQLQVWHILAASLLFGLVSAFFQPAYAALTPQIVPEGNLSSANALTSISTNLGRVAGPALGAVFVGWQGSSLAFLINGLSFLISSALLLPLLFEHIPAPARGAETRPLDDLRQGIGTVLGIPWLWISILAFALINFTLAGPYSVAMPFLVRDFMGADVNTLGQLYAIFPVGYILGGVWMGRYARMRRRGWLMYLALALAALMLTLFGFHLPFWLLAGAALVNGAGLEIFGLAWTQLLQEKIPNEQLGRVSSIDAMGSFSLLPLGLAAAGWATGALGPAPVFIIGGLLTAVISVVILAHPAIRGLD